MTEREIRIVIELRQLREGWRAIDELLNQVEQGRLKLVMRVDALIAELEAEEKKRPASTDGRRTRKQA